MSSTDSESPRLPATGTFFVGSVVVHVGLLLALGAVALPEAMEISVPDLLEFGIADGQGGMGGGDEEPDLEPPPPPPPPPPRGRG